MSAKSCRDRINSKDEKKKSELLLSNEIPETELNKDLPAPKTAADNSFKLVDHKEENLCNWLNSGFYLFASQDPQENRDKAAALAHPRGMAQMTVQNYMRSLHRFSEMPVLSRWNSTSSSHSLPSAPKSVAEWLDFSEKDPVEILLDLGFGTDEPDICTKIPSRFISCVSTAKGINIRVFIEAQRQRLDLENPNLCGRFRQLQVLDHVTSAFSSLLNDISTVQHKSEECSGGAYSADNSKGKTVITQAKRRRIGQLLRKVSRQKTLHGPQTYWSAGRCQDTEPYTFAVDMDSCLASKTALPEGAALVSVQEELDASEEEATAVTQPALLSFSKARVLPHLLKKQSQLPCASEMPTKDKSHKESNLLLSHMFKKYSLNCKPSDSFEMEEIQSFEDEYFCGNPLESTSDTIVMRTNSCQSDSSGFLEDTPDPLPLQGLSGNLRFSSNSHDCQPFLRHKKDSSLTIQDLPLNAESPVASTAIADGGNVLLLSSLSREHNFPGEEIFYSINEEDDSYETLGDKCEKAAEGTAHEMSKTRMKDKREELEEEEREVQDWLSCCHVDEVNRASISHPEKWYSHYVSEKHQREDSASVQESCKVSRRQTHEERKECEELLRGQEEVTDVCREDVLEGVNECVDEKFYNKKSCRNSADQITEVSSNDQDAKQGATAEPLTIPEEPQTEPGILVVQPESSSRKLLQDSSLSPYYLEKEDVSSVEILSASTQLDQGRHIPSFETNASFKSVTVQMPSRLMSSQRTFSLGETHVKNLSLYLNSNISPCSNETLTASIQQASKEIDDHKREVSIQTEDRKKKESFPWLHSLPTFHWHGHLLKSASLDTGLYGKYRPYCHEPSHDLCAAHTGHCCALKSHNCCLLWSFLSTHSCRHAVACCSSHATTELQLLKTLRLLQDTAMRNISSCTVHEIDAMKNSCQKFREQLDEIEQHLMEQEALFSTAMSNEGREERRHLQILRQAVRQEVAELEYQLQDRARQVKEGLLMHLDQLLGEQSNLCSELGIPERREEREAQNEPTEPGTDAALLSRPGCSKKICHKLPGRSATVPSSPSDSLPRDTELGATALATTKANSTSDPKELHTGKKEAKGLSPSKIDFKAFIKSLKKSFRSSFSNDTQEERN